MKKVVGLALLLLFAALLAIPAFAADTGDAGDADSWLEQRLNWLQQRMELKRAYVDRLVEQGLLSKEQGQAWKEHFEYMYDFHRQNGFLCPGGGPGWRHGWMGGSYGNGPGAGMRGMGPVFRLPQGSTQNL